MVKVAQRTQHDPGNGPLIISLCLTLSILRFSIWGIFPVCLELVAPLPSCISGSPLWKLTVSPSSVPVLCVPTSHQPLAGQLHPLPVSSHPWTHIALNFLTGLPPSQGNTVILTTVYHFSKVVKLIVFPKPPTVHKTIKLLVLYVQPLMIYDSYACGL